MSHITPKTHLSDERKDRQDFFVFTRLIFQSCGVRTDRILRAFSPCASKMTVLTKRPVLTAHEHELCEPSLSGNFATSRSVAA